MDMKKFKSLIAKKIGSLTVSLVAFCYNISYSDATMKSSVLSHHIQKVTFCGSNMHSKGAYFINIPTTIQCNDKPHQTAADYLAAVLCHNIQTKSSYQKTVQVSLAIAMHQISNLRIFEVINKNVDKEAAIDIAAVLSQNTKLQEIYLNRLNLQSEGAIVISRSLQNTVNLNKFILSNNNINEEAADDIATVLSHSAKLQVLGLGGNNLHQQVPLKLQKVYATL